MLVRHEAVEAKGFLAVEGLLALTVELFAGRDGGAVVMLLALRSPECFFLCVLFHARKPVERNSVFFIV